MIRIRVALANMTTGPGLSTFFFDTTGATEAGAAATAVAAFYGDLEPVIRTPGTYLVEPVAAEINPATGVITGFYPVPAGGGTGSGAAEALPRQCQGLLRLRTDEVVAGRLLQGRMFVPGPTQNELDNGLTTAAYRTTVDTAAEVLLAAQPTWSVWSRAHGIVAPIVDTSVAQTFATLNSRRD